MEQGRKDVVGWRERFGYTLSSLLPDLSQHSVRYTALKSAHCKHAASASHAQTGGCGVPAPLPWGWLVGGRAPMKRSILEAGAVDVYVAITCPSSAH